MSTKYIGFTRVRYLPSTPSTFLIVADARVTNWMLHPGGGSSKTHMTVKTQPVEVTVPQPINLTRRDDLFAEELNALNNLKTLIMAEGFTSEQASEAIGNANVFRPFRLPEVAG